MPGRRRGWLGQSFCAARHRLVPHGAPSNVRRLTLDPPRSWPCRCSKQACRSTLRTWRLARRRSRQTTHFCAEGEPEQRQGHRRGAVRPVRCAVVCRAPSTAMQTRPARGAHRAAGHGVQQGGQVRQAVRRLRAQHAHRVAAVPLPAELKNLPPAVEKITRAPAVDPFVAKPKAAPEPVPTVGALRAVISASTLACRNCGHRRPPLVPHPRPSQHRPLRLPPSCQLLLSRLPRRPRRSLFPSPRRHQQRLHRPSRRQSTWPTFFRFAARLTAWQPSHT